LTTLIFIPPL